MKFEDVEKFAVVLSSGNGERFGANRVGKHLVEIGSVPSLVWAVSTLLSNHNLFSEIVIVTREHEQRETQKVLDRFFELESVRISVIAGGGTRMESFVNAVNFINGKSQPADQALLMLVDANRPLFSNAQVLGLLQGGLNGQGSCLTRPVVDGIAEVRGGRIRAVPNKDDFFEFVTPEVASLKVVNSLLDAGEGPPRSLVEFHLAAGHYPEMVPASSSNMKLTYPEDLQILEELAKQLSKPQPLSS